MRVLSFLNIAQDNKTYNSFITDALDSGGEPKWASYGGPEVFYLAIVAWHL